mmetsp:Transcript_18675/g.25889  ORF Transcript_18675/g.25889 Transcript_18675/m.25889 type:complete len:341 (+) Transcript_18675:167-1189(+)
MRHLQRLIIYLLASLQVSVSEECGNTAGFLASLPPVESNLEPLAAQQLHDIQCKTLVTAQPRDGLGGSLIARMAAIATAKARGICYVHTPFYELDHVPGSEKDMEAFTNIGDGEIDIRNIGGFQMERNHNNFDAYEHVEEKCISNSDCPSVFVCVSVRRCMEVATHDLEVLYPMLPVFRERYHRTPKPEINFEEGAVHVAVHVRRGDVDDDRYVRDDVHLLIIENIRKEQTQKGTKVKFHIFSQGDPNAFKVYTEGNLDTELHIHSNTNEHGSAVEGAVGDLNWTFHAMVKADILVVTRSALSYVAAWLSVGKIYQIPHEKYPSLKEWKVVGPAESPDTD